ncbi:peptide ABC transporter permease [Allosphingosinicella sp.]|uniref:peptide ABC transporter permease n=1 Tax=Allosphingosinicella sp. TaxID=2823234 RepID=UPI003D7294ED
MEPEKPTAKQDEAPHISAEDARGGEIILRTRRRRIIFIAGLVGFVVLALLLKFYGFI